MKRWIALFLVAMLMCACFPVSAAENQLESYKGVHPKLFVNEFETLQKNIEANPRMKALFEQFLGDLDEYIKQEPTPYYESSNTEDNWMRDHGDRIGDLALAYRLTGETKYLDAARAWTTTALGYPSWGRGNAEDCDLAASHMIVGMSVLYDWCFDELSAEEKTAILEKFKVCGSKFPAAWHRNAFLQNHLWHAANAMVISGIAVYDEYPQSQEWIDWGTMKYEQVFHFLSDGATHEGYTYWLYGTRPLIYYTELAKKFLNRDYTSHSHLQHAWEYGFYAAAPFDAENATEITNFPFGDATTNRVPEALGYMAYYAGLTKNKTAQWMTNRLVDFRLRNHNTMTSWRDFIFYDYSLEEEHPSVSTPTTKWFDDLGFVFLRSDWGADASAVAMRSGPVMGEKACDPSIKYYNLGASHAHADVAHFSVYANGEWILPDDGYVKNSTGQHNTLLVDGFGQHGDEAVWSKEAVWASPTVDKVYSDDVADYVVMNATAAYPSELGVEKFERHLIYLKPEVILIVDDIQTNKAQSLELRFHPEGQTSFRQSDNSYIFFGKNTKYVIKPFLTPGVTSSDEMLTEYSDKNGSTRDQYAIRVQKNADSWQQMTAVTWGARSKDAKSVDMTQDGDNVVFTVENATVRLNMATKEIQVERMEYPLNVKYNNAFIPFTDAPILENGRILVPYTAIIDAMNLTTDFHEDTRQIEFRTQDKKVEMKMLSNRFVVNGEQREMDAVPVMRNGSLYIPLRALCEALDLNIFYDETASVAQIFTDASDEIGILGIFVNNTVATLVAEEENHYTSTIMGANGLTIDVLPSVKGTRVLLDTTDSIFGDQKITLISPDGLQTKEYILTTSQVKGLGDIGIVNLSYSDSDGNIGENTVDGQYTTRWSAEGVGQWILYDFGQPTDVGKVGIAFNSGKTRVAYFEIQTSEDGESFTTVLDSASSGASDELEYFTLPAGTRTRYIRLVGKGNSKNAWNSPTEVAFFAE